jgi:hypothetical protein
MPGKIGWLKAATLAVQKPKFSIVSYLMKELGGWQSPRSMKTVHASDITKPGFCPRHWALLDILAKQKKDEYIDTALNCTFDIGKATADVATNKWLAPIAIGHWKCRSCGEFRSWCKKPAVGCTKMQIGANCYWEYQEVNFVSKVSDVSGSIDVLLDMGAPKLHVTELKIMAVDAFEKLLAPLPEHRVRTSLYMQLISESDSIWKDKINTDEAKILYITRGFGKKNVKHDNEVIPFKEFDIQRDDEITVKPVQRAQQLMHWRKNGKMPSGICSIPLDMYAKKCNCAAECFGGLYPAEQPKI